MARPKLSPDERHSEQINIPLRPVDLARLQAKADQAETTITDFVRAAALGKKLNVIQSNAPDFDTVEQLRRIGVNLNQIAKAMNAQQATPPQALETACATLQTLLAKWMFDDNPNHDRPQF